MLVKSIVWILTFDDGACFFYRVTYLIHVVAAVGFCASYIKCSCH